MIDKTKIDLACGDAKKEGFFGVDIADIEGVDLVHDLTVYPWPIEDNIADEINCSHYIEHIKHDTPLTDIKELLNKSTSFDEFKENMLNAERHQDGFIRFMKEVYRILKPGGKVRIIAPYVMHTRAFGDPTHERYIHDMSFAYFNKEWREANKLEHYNIDVDFDIRYSYSIDQDLILKSAEVREEAFKK